MTEFFTNFSNQLGQFLPNLLGAIAILILGWLLALVLAGLTRGLLKRTNLDNRLASMVTGTPEGSAQSPPVEQWAATAVFWITMLFVLVAFLNALQLGAVSEPLNNFLDQIFAYLPKVGGALALLGVAWLVATVCKLLLTRGLQQFGLDERLNRQLGATEGQPSIVLNETLANALYWFIFLFFLPFILDALDLQGPLEPVQSLLDQILSALPRILTAIIIGVVGWLVARVVSGAVTNLLAASGADQLGSRVGLTQETSNNLTLSRLVGTLVYVLVLIPTAIAALNALQIDAISGPAVSMLETVLQAIPQVLMAGVVLAVFYFIGRIVSELVTNVFTNLGFNNVFNWLGLPTMPGVSSEAQPATPTDAGTPPMRQRTPSEILGAIAWVAVVLFGAVAAAEVLQFAELTSIVRAILRISIRVLSGVAVFGVGLYLANLAFSLINSTGNRQARILAQTARIAILALVGAMALQQMGVATSIVNLAFGLLFGALAVAIALAFGLGGRDIAAEQIREWLDSFKRG